MAIRPSYRKADPRRFYDAKDQRQLVERYDESAGVYDEAMSSDVGWVGHIELASVVGRYVARDAQLLDAGAGTGMLGDELAKLGFTNMDANDLSPGMLERARGKEIYRECRVMELGRPLDYPDNVYDAVVVCGVFTPNHAPASSLDEMARITNPRGLILYTLRADETPVDFPPKHQELAGNGAWTLVESCAPFPSIGSEPHIRHQCWVFRVL